MVRRGMARAASVVFLLGLVSRVTSFARQLVIAGLFGASGAMDANSIAGMITGVTGIITGSLAMASLPVISSDLVKGDTKAARRVISSIVTLSLTAVFAIAVAGVRYAPQLVRIAGPGLRGSTFDDAVMLTRMYFPAAALPLLSTFGRHALNASGQFGIPALSAAVHNVAMVTAVVALAPPLGVRALALASILGGLGALLIQLPSWRKTGTSPQLTFCLNRDTCSVLALSVPLMVRTAFMQVHNLVGRNLASRLAEGSVSVLGYAGRLQFLPIGLFVTSITTVIYPSLSAMWAKKDRAGFKNTVSSAIRYVEFVCVPATVLMMVLAEPIVRLAYQRGAFTAQATTATAQVLAITAPGLVAAAVSQVVGYAFYSSQQTRIPVLLGIGTALLNTALDLALIGPWGLAGLAAAHTLGGIAGSIAGVYLLVKYIGKMRIWPLAQSMGKAIVASVIAGAVALQVSEATGFAAGTDRFLMDLAAATATLGAAAAVYIGVASLLRAEELTPVVRLLRERLAPRQP